MANAIVAVKPCSLCKKILPATTEFFHKKLDGLASRCRECTNAEKREYWRKNAGEVNSKRREDRAIDPEPFRAKDNERYRTGRKLKPEQRSPYNSEVGRRYYLKHREQKLEWQRQYQQVNKERINEYAAKYNKARRESDPLFSLRLRVRALISFHLRNNGSRKSARTEQILGCTFDEFMAHIEKQFTKGMSWENRDEWHIDHITPMASAESEHDVLALNHFTNLRPMWAKDNIAKGADRTHLI